MHIDQAMTQADAARELGVHQSYLQRLIEAGRIKAYLTAGNNPKSLVPVSEVERMKKERAK